jgi:hypothetical protein
MPILSIEETSSIIESSRSLPQSYLDLEDIVWTERGPDGDRRARLCAILAIGGIHMHVDAYEAWMETNEFDAEADEFKRFPLDHDDGDELRFEITDGAGDLWNAHGMEGAAKTVEIEGRHYCIFMHPYCT